MKFILWFSYKMILGNIKRAFFPFLGVTVGISALIMALSISDGGEKIISKNLTVISDNRIMLGGTNLNQKDIDIIESYPMVQYAIFPEARILENNNIFIAYPPKALQLLNLNNLEDNEIIVDKNQFPDKKIGDKVDLFLANKHQIFIIKDMYIEENPIELMHQGKRIIISQNYFEKLFNKYSFSQMTVAFDKNEDVEDILPFLLNKFNSDRRSFYNIKILETPEVYKRVVKIQKLVKNTLTILAVISIAVGSIGITTLISSGVRNRTTHIGILRTIGLSKKDITQIFLVEGGIIALLGSITGIIIGIVFSIFCGKLIMIPPVFNFIKIISTIILSLVLGIGLGILPAKKAGNMEIVDALKEL